MSRFIPRIGLLFIFLLISQLTEAQDKLIDSLSTKARLLEKKSGFSELDTTYIKTLNALSISYIYKNRDSSRAIGEKALELSKTIDFRKGIAGAKLALANAAVFDGKYENCLEYVDQAITLSKKIEADTIHVRSLNVKAMVFFLKKDFPKTYTIYKNGIKKAQEIGLKELELRLTMNMATTFSLIKDYEKALELYYTSLELSNEIDNPLNLAQIEANLGYLYWKTQEFEKGKRYTQNAMKSFQELAFPSWESFTLITLGGIALEEEMIEEAIVYYKKAMALLENNQDKKRETDSFLGLSEAYLLKGNIELSDNYASTANKIAKSINYYEGIIESSKLLYRIKKKNNMPSEAITYLEVVQHLSDSIDLAENSQRLRMMVAQNNFEGLQMKQSLENMQKLSKQKNINVIIIMALITSCFVALLIRKNYADQKKANIELQRINETKDKIFSIIGHDLKTPLNTLNELLELLREQVISPKEMTSLTPKIQQNVDYSTFTLNNLLFWAQSQMNSVVAQAKNLNIKSHVDETLFVFAIDRTKKNIRVTNNVSNDHIIKFDCEHLRIILRNLINNAIKFTPEDGLITINSSVVNGTVTIQICDTGIGIKEAKMDEFFNSNTIKSTKGTNNEKGTGLGLSLCKELTDMNNATLLFTKNKEIGSCFSIIGKTS